MGPRVQPPHQVLHHLKIGWDPLATDHHQVHSVGLGCLGANHHQVSLTDQGSNWKDEHPVLRESVEIGYPVRLHVLPRCCWASEHVLQLEGAVCLPQTSPCL